MVDVPFHKLPLKKAYSFGQGKGLGREIAEIEAMEIDWPPKRGSSVRRGYIVELFESHALMRAFVALHWPCGKTQEGQWHRNYVVRLKERFEAGGEEHC